MGCCWIWAILVAGFATAIERTLIGAFRSMSQWCEKALFMRKVNDINAAKDIAQLLWSILSARIAFQALSNFALYCGCIYKTTRFVHSCRCSPQHMEKQTALSFLALAILIEYFAETQFHPGSTCKLYKLVVDPCAADATVMEYIVAIITHVILICHLLQLCRIYRYLPGMNRFSYLDAPPKFYCPKCCIAKQVHDYNRTYCWWTWPCKFFWSRPRCQIAEKLKLSYIKCPCSRKPKSAQICVK